MLKVLAIMGSPRRKKNNEALLEKMLEGVLRAAPQSHIDRVYISDIAVEPCSACDACTLRPACVKKDSMEEIYRMYDPADLVILTSPLYFNSISAQLKALIDRNQVIWSSKYILKQSMLQQTKRRLGFLLCTAGAKEQPYGLSAVIPIFDLYFKSINTEYWGNYFVSGVDEAPAYESPKVLAEAEARGYEMAKYFIAGEKNITEY